MVSDQLLIVHFLSVCGATAAHFLQRLSAFVDRVQLSVRLLLPHKSMCVAKVPAGDWDRWVPRALPTTELKAKGARLEAIDICLLADSKTLEG